MQGIRGKALLFAGVLAAVAIAVAFNVLMVWKISPAMLLLNTQEVVLALCCYYTRHIRDQRGIGRAI